MLIEKQKFPSHIVLPKPLVRKVSQGKKKLLASGSEDMLYIIQVTRMRNNSQPSQNGEKENASSPKIIAERLVVPLDPMVKCSGLSIRACNGHINFSAPTERVCQSESVQSAETSKKSGMKHDIGGNCLSSPQHYQVKKRKFEIRMNRSSFDPEEFALYRRYQLKVHNDKPDNITETSYHRFLVDTPLLFVSPTGDSTFPPCGFGSFHQQYLIDGKLVVVGVIDVLPKCLSGKYLFWDPDFTITWLLYSLLQQDEIQSFLSSIRAFVPTSLSVTCIISRWVPFDITRPLLDKRPYVVLSDSSVLKNGNSFLPQATEDS
ncbi:hypothetical protein Ahy_B10g102696 [Arachis hypogaea]|uniref:N-end rule aminoacyl transferase C-terminal domain-containing protein n=1 Tax=Arachis hypogaea TaxID=3818 RepID=A0A444X2E4_ARAHY|nr:hypothetical protein Ahy_B10g102696 [Arachis hypogaea]